MQSECSRSGPGGASAWAACFFGAFLLLFIQTLTAWLESMYRVGLTRLALGMEVAGLAVALAPLLVFVWPLGAQRNLLWAAVVVSLGARAMLPLAGAGAGIVIGGAGTGAFLVALCLMLARPYRS